jgi:hypothetical protein
VPKPSNRKSGKRKTGHLGGSPAAQRLLVMGDYLSLLSVLASMGLMVKVQCAYATLATQEKAESPCAIERETIFW